MRTIKVKFKSRQSEEDFLISLGIRDIRTGLRDYFVQSTTRYLMDPVKYVIYLDQNCYHKLGMWIAKDLIEVKERKVSVEYFDKLNKLIYEKSQI
jgi:hypothetical protein